jgi:hypothetical protein
MIITQTIDGVTTERKATPEEEKYFSDRQLESEKYKKEEEDKLQKIEDSKNSAKAKLAALGLTPEEISAIS